MPEVIRSPQNPKIKEIKKLRKARERWSRDLVLVEGYHELEMAVRGGLSFNSLFYCPELSNKKTPLDNFATRETIEVSKAVFESIAYREHPDGFLATTQARNLPLNKIRISKNSLVIVLEAVEKPGNLGAILRTADAAGADAVLLCNSQTDIYNPNVIRASLGTVFTNQIAVCSNLEAIEWLESRSISSYATTPDAKENYTGMDYNEASAFIIGTEHSGLSEVWLKAANEKILIPMRGEIDSLNASVSTAVVVFEALRQRAEE